jgi:ABC-2 type transport system permease protein
VSPGAVRSCARSAEIIRAWRAFFATMRMAATVPRSDVLVLAATVGLRLLQFGVFVGIWRSLPAEQLAASGVSVPSLLTYTAVSQAIATLLNPQTTLNQHLANGTLSVRLLWPMGVVSQFVSEMLGSVFPVTALSIAALAAVAPLLGVSLAPSSPPLLCALSLLLAMTVGVAVDFLFALLTVRLGNSIWFVTIIRTASTSVISGALIPLNLMPWHIGDVLQALPFAAMAFGPLRIYTEPNGAVPLLVSQAGWAVVLWVGLVVWARRSRDKVVGLGG